MAVQNRAAGEPARALCTGKLFVVVVLLQFASTNSIRVRCGSEQTPARFVDLGWLSFSLRSLFLNIEPTRRRRLAQAAQ